MTRSPRILGTGYAVPAKIRKNDEPIFAWLIAHPQPVNPFFGYEVRHVLDNTETLLDLMVPAAQSALQAAELQPEDIDLLLGCASISDYWTPNDLGLLHQTLGLPESTWVVPLSNDFSNFAAGLFFADGAIRAGRVKNALIVAGGNWTRYVSYQTGQAASAADGAGAAVIGVRDKARLFAVAGQETITASQYYGAMFMKGDPDYTPSAKRVWTDPYFHITDVGLKAFGAFGLGTAWQAVTRLLKKHNVPSEEIGLISHQASKNLLDQWKKELHLKDDQMYDTIKTFANMTVANVPVNLAYRSSINGISHDKLVLLSLGLDLHANALLLVRE